MHSFLTHFHLVHKDPAQARDLRNYYFNYRAFCKQELEREKRGTGLLLKSACAPLHLAATATSLALINFHTRPGNSRATFFFRFIHVFRFTCSSSSLTWSFFFLFFFRSSCHRFKIISVLCVESVSQVQSLVSMHTCTKLSQK